MSLSVVTIDGDAVDRQGDAWLVEERGEYRVVAPGAERVVFGGADLLRDPKGFLLLLSFWTGRAQAVVYRGELREPVELLVRAAANKLDPDEWEVLLDAIDRRWPGCTLGVEGGLHGRVGDEGIEGLLALLAFEPLLDEFLHELTALLEALRTRELFPERYVPLRTVRRLDASTARWVATRVPSLAATSPLAASGTSQDFVVPHRQREVSWDHPANRTIRWLVERLAARLDLVATMLRSQAERLHDSLTDARRWCHDRAQRLEDAAERIDVLLRRSVLARVVAAPPDTAAILTLSNDPLYARVYRRCRRWLAPRIDRTVGADVPIRTSFDLYERWCLLSVRQALADAIPKAVWSDASTTATDAFASASNGVAAVGRSDAGTVTLYDNLTFSAWSQDARGRYSISTERRPDFVVTWAGRDGARRWVALDAKYRASQGSIAKALEEIHVYRDALRWPEFSGPCRAAVVLVPALSAGAERWARDEFVDRFHFGCITMRPKADVTALARRLRHWLLSADA